VALPVHRSVCQTHAMCGGRTGYLHPGYAASFVEFGDVRPLARSGAWLLVRPIEGTAHCDAIAGYRHLFCADWAGLAADLAACADLVSVTAVTDPLGSVQETDLRRAFPEVVRRYKDNRIIDLHDLHPSRHHRAETRKALKAVDVRVEPDPSARLDDWETLYGELRIRHGLSGLGAFSKTAFRAQLATPGCVAFRAVAGGDAVAMSLWYVMGEVAHYHLSASNADGYRASASYALMQTAIESFAQRGVRMMNLGAAAGVEAEPDDGLSRFKAGWTLLVRPSYLCGRINEPVEYARLAARRGTAPSAYFPAYRAGEHR